MFKNLVIVSVILVSLFGCSNIQSHGDTVIISTSTQSKMVELVDEKLKQGYQVSGNITNSGNGLVYIVTMVKKGNK